MVGTKAFLLSIVMMPVLMLGGIVAIQLLNRVGEVKERTIVIADQSGQLLDVLKQASEARNATIKKALEEQEEGGEKEDFGGAPSLSRAELYFIEEFDGQIDEDSLLELSDKVRDQEIYAFCVIPKNVIDASTEGMDEDNSVRFYAQDSSLSSARGWLRSVIYETAKTQRLVAADIDPLIVQKASKSIQVKGLGLVSRSSDGSVSKAEEKDELQAIFLPMGVMMLMFMVIFMASQPMLESVLEEKSQRIAEVLLGSANPFQLMCGKLIGTVGGSITVFLIYMSGLYFVAQNRGWMDFVPFHLMPWFVVFQILGVLFYAAIFMAVGASVSQLKEAQSMLLPVWMLLMAPLFIWIFLVQDPTGSVATWFSLFPPATPTTMMLRLATGQTIPIWQPLVGIVLTTLSTLAIVIVAGRIFRVGILWQGKTPKLSEILRWGLSG